MFLATFTDTAPAHKGGLDGFTIVACTLDEIYSNQENYDRKDDHISAVKSVKDINQTSRERWPVPYTLQCRIRIATEEVVHQLESPELGLLHVNSMTCEFSDSVSQGLMLVAMQYIKYHVDVPNGNGVLLPALRIRSGRSKPRRRVKDVMGGKTAQNRNMNTVKLAKAGGSNSANVSFIGTLRTENRGVI